MSFQIKITTLSNIKRKEEQDEKSNLKIKEEHDFFEKPDQFKDEVKEDLYMDLEHKKNRTPLHWTAGSGCRNNRN